MAELAVCLPLPVQIVIDDVGWWSGRDGHEQGEPFRTGIARDHQPADYRAISELGRRLGMRPQAAMVLCEWDRTDRLRAVPSATWMGADWRNRWVGPWLDEAAEVLRDGHVEPILHGVGHEWWDERGMSRAEWFGPDGLRPLDAVRAHLDAFLAIWQENRLGPEPTSFVPCAFLYQLGAGLAPVLAEYGIHSVSTPYQRLPERPDGVTLAWDDHLPVVDRGQDLLRWFALGQRPSGEVLGPVCGLHWPNVLHLDPAHNGEVVDGWVELLKPYDQRPDRMLAPDTARWLSQLAFWQGCRQRRDGAAAVIDLPEQRAGEWLRLKLSGGGPLTIRGATVLADAPRDGWRQIDLAVPADSEVVRLEPRDG